MIVRELVTRLSFSSDRKQAQNYEKTIADIRRTAIRATAAVTALATGTFELSRRIANAGNEVAKGAVEVGLAADEYQRLRFAIGQVTRLSDREANRALEKLNETIGRARTEGGRYAEDLARVGITQAEIESGALSNAEAFERVTSALGRTRDANEAAALAARVLGQRSGRLLGPALRENADAMGAATREAQRLGGGWSEAGLTASEDFVDSMGRTQLILTTITSNIAEKLLPAVQSVIDSFVDWWAINRDIIQQNIARTMERIGVAFRIVASIVRGFVSAANRVAEALGGWGRTIRLLTIALGTLIGLKFAFWLGSVASALSVAAKAAGALRIAMIALSTAGILGLFVLLALAIEDVVTWIQGGDSAIGKWLGSWEDFREKALGVIDDVLEYLKPLIKQFEAVGEVIAGAFALDPDMILSGLNKLGNSMVAWAKSIGASLRDAILAMLPDWMVSAFKTADEGIEGVVGAVTGGAAGTGGAARDPGTDVAAGGGFLGSRVGRVDVNARTEAVLQVPQGTSEEQRRAIENQTARIFSEHWDREIRSALWDFQPVD